MVEIDLAKIISKSIYDWIKKNGKTLYKTNHTPKGSDRITSSWGESPDGKIPDFATHRGILIDITEIFLIETKKK